MAKWEPDIYEEDPIANALLNVAAGIHRLADAHGELLYALKYSKQEGMSVAEAIEVAGKNVGEAVERVAIDLSNALQDAAMRFEGDAS